MELGGKLSDGSFQFPPQRGELPRRGDALGQLLPKWKLLLHDFQVYVIIKEKRKTGRDSLKLPELNADGYLDPGIYLALLDEVLERFGTGSARERLSNLLRLIVENARKYPTIKRVWLWGSFISAKPEPADLDYSIVVDPRHRTVTIED